jgi:hypothetical protein
VIPLNESNDRRSSASIIWRADDREIATPAAGKGGYFVKDIRPALFLRAAFAASSLRDRHHAPGSSACGSPEGIL